MAAPFIQMEMTSRGIKQLADPALASRARFAMVEAALPIVFAQAKAEAPGSGRTKAKALVKFMDDSTATGHVRALFPLNLVAKGTRRHPIPKKGTRRRGDPVLRFVFGGGTMFRRRVMHKGARANPFMEEAARNSAQAATRAADDALQAVLDHAGR
jgi:hypothetical protein